MQKTDGGLVEKGETNYKHTKQLRMVMYNYYYDIIHRK